jgi:hypothetical protein
MLYKDQRIEREFKLLHPELLKLAGELEAYCRAKHYAEPVSTHVKRYGTEQVDIYWKNIMATKKVTEVEAKALAAKRPTLHYHLLAFDLRSFIYTPMQMKDLLQWLESRCPKAKGWEILYHDVGRGNHFHIGYNDVKWRAAHPMEQKP